MIKAPRGTKDIIAPESYLWHEIEQTVAEVARLFCYDEIRTPVFEDASLFKRSVGDETDIVSKEMYLFTDKSGDEMSLRPELTASVVRAVLEHKLIAQQGAFQKLYYNSAPMFRYERPQLGRQRQFHQFGVEVLGAASPLADLQVIDFAISVYQRLGFANFHLKLNSLGSQASRDVWREKLVAYLDGYRDSLSEDSKRRLETNPLRILDSKNPGDQEICMNAPNIIEHLNADDTAHFNELQSLLRSSGIEYSIVPTLVRGLDYYSRTVFELTSTDLGSQDALCGGGRYDGLIEKLGGAPTPAVGFAAGVERLIIVLQKLRGETTSPKPDYYIVTQSPDARQMLLSIASRLQKRTLSVNYDVMDRSMKAQMKDANRTGAKKVILIGADELASGAVLVKDMESGEQRSVTLDELLS